MFSLFFKSPNDQLIAELWESGTAGIQEEEDALRAFFEGDEHALMAQFAAYQPDLRYEETRDWAHAWQDPWEAVLVGTRFFLVPAWRDDPTPPGRLRLEMHPGQACGTGAHPATQLMLEALETRLRTVSTVLDIGTGSGILSEAAILLGAHRVVACDIDPLAIEAARQRGPFLLFRGSARSVKSQSVDLVLANINAATIVDLAPEIPRVLKPRGIAILGGFTERDHARVAAHFQVEEVLAKDDWIALVASR